MRTSDQRMQRAVYQGNIPRNFSIIPSLFLLLGKTTSRSAIINNNLPLLSPFPEGVKVCKQVVDLL